MQLFNISVDFYIDDLSFALLIFTKDSKTVHCNGSEINRLINLKYSKRTDCRDIFCTINAGFSLGGKSSTTLQGSNLCLFMSISRPGYYSLIAI